MPSVTVRQLEPELVDELKRIAAANGRSLEAELRLLLKRFVDLPWESRVASLPVAMLPTPRWYTELWEVQLDFGFIALNLLPPRRSRFRSAGNVRSGEIAV